jgi:hypothetical protein
LCWWGFFFSVAGNNGFEMENAVGESQPLFVSRARTDLARRVFGRASETTTRRRFGTRTGKLARECDLGIVTENETNERTTTRALSEVHRALTTTPLPSLSLSSPAQAREFRARHGFLGKTPTRALLFASTARRVNTYYWRAKHYYKGTGICQGGHGGMAIQKQRLIAQGND